MRVHRHNDTSGRSAREAIPLDAVDCIECAEELERVLRRTPDVVNAHVDFRGALAHVEYDSTAIAGDRVRELINGSGRCRCEGPGAQPADHTAIKHHAQMAPITMGGAHDRMQHELAATSARARHEEEHERAASHAGMDHDMSDPTMAKSMEADMRRRFWVALVLAIPTVLYSPLVTDFFNIELPTGPFDPNWIMLVLSTPVVWWAGWIFIGGAYHSLRRRSLNMSVLIATGVLAAWGFSVVITVGDLGETFFEAAVMLVTFVLFGHWMEMKSRRGTTDALRALFDLVPPTATVMRDGREVELATSEIVVGDRVVLRPGDKVAVDGVIESGETAIDEALVTGESVPVEKRPGDEVIGGSINTTGSIVFRATSIGADTALGQIVRLVEQAQSSKAPGQRLADRAAQYLVVLAVASGAITFAGWYGIAGESALFSLTFAVSAIVIACPDALGLATPTAVAVGTGLGARHNILIKDAATLEALADIDTVVLDKTGTLTEGKPALTDVIATDGDEDELLTLAAAAEAGSEHPIARAIVKGAEARGRRLPEAREFRSMTGMGLQAAVDGRALLIGNRRLMETNGVSVDGLEGNVAALGERGRTALYVAVDGRPAGVVAVADAIKPTAAAAIGGLRAFAVEPVMITGDNARTAKAVAEELGIERVFADVLPADKARHVRELQAEGKRVAMVGDGVNDAPALAQADVGIAIGAGTDVAIETARVVLMRSDPLDVARGIRLGKATSTKMKQNLFWASIYNVLAIPVAAGVLYPSMGVELRPEWAALLMSLSSIVVATNAVLLKRVEPAIVAGV
jgi:Cu2+-exporting ATPase